MASLIPLLHDLLPMIIPSEVQVVQGDQLDPIKERAERPPWYQHQHGGEATSSTSVSRGPGAGVKPEASIESSHAQHEPIHLFDHEDHATSADLIGDGIQKDRTNSSSHNAYVPVPPPSDGPEVFRRDAKVGATGNMCVSVLTVRPRSASGIRHFGEQDTVIYATSGHGVLLLSPPVDAVKALRADLKGEDPAPLEEIPRRLELKAGDFAFIPAWTEHQIVNEHSDQGDVTWVLMRIGTAPIQVDLDGWGGATIE